MRWAARLLKFFRVRNRLVGRSEEELAQEAFLASTLGRFERTIGYTIRNRDIFAQALLHRSFSQRPHTAVSSNERLEFFGDSILNLIVAEYLYQHFPHAPEGELTKMRSRLVNRRALAAYARAIKLSDFILMSPSAAHAIGKGFETITSDTFEAVIAALYLDGGFNAARAFVERQVLSAIKKGAVKTSDDNYKSMLLEYTQSHGLGTPRYAIVKQEGPDHDRTFTVDVLIGNVRRGTGTGKNKKEAEQAAASQALARIH
jgi:ribonuclease-3